MSEARVRVGERIVGAIGPGLLALVGVSVGDDERDAHYVAAKLPVLRVFEGVDGKPMDRSLRDVGGSVLVVSQFTLLGDVRGQRRPSFTEAAPPDLARHLYELLVRTLRDAGVPVETGEFQATMRVELVNEGPVTLLLDSKRQF